MYLIVNKKELAQDTFMMEIEAPRLSRAALPGQFLIIKMTEKAERIPLTISDNDPWNGTVTIVFTLTLPTC